MNILRLNRLARATIDEVSLAAVHGEIVDTTCYKKRPRVHSSVGRSPSLTMDEPEIEAGGPGSSGSIGEEYGYALDNVSSDSHVTEYLSSSSSAAPLDASSDMADGPSAQDGIQGGEGEGGGGGGDDGLQAPSVPVPTLDPASLLRPPVSLRSSHSIASPSSGLHRIAEDPDAPYNGDAPLSTTAQERDGSTRTTEAGSPQLSPPIGGNELGFTAAAHEPILTSTPTEQRLDSTPHFGMGAQASELLTPLSIIAPGAGTGASMASRKPFQRTLSMPLGNKLGQLQRPQRSSQRIPTMRTASSTSFKLSKSSDPQSSASLVQENSSGDQVASGGGVDDGSGRENASNRHQEEEGASSEHADGGDDAESFPALLADTLQLSISTLLQLISPHLLDPSHERYSASSIQVPVTSIEALLESHRALNWLCAKMDDAGSISASDARRAAHKISVAAENAARLARDAAEEDAEDVVLVGSSAPPAESIASAFDIPTTESPASTSVPSTSRAPSTFGFSRIERPSPSTAVSSLHLPNHMSSRTTSSLMSASSPIDGSGPSDSPTHDEVDFDIAELVQRAADAVSGQAAGRGVEIALCPPVFSLLNDGSANASGSLAQTLGMSVRGDEGAVRFGMLHALSKIVEQCERGRTVHAALCVTELPESVAEAYAQSSNGKGKAREAGANVQCCLHIYQTPQDGESLTGGSTEKDAGLSGSIKDPTGRQRRMQRALSTKFLQGICCRVTVRDVPWPHVLSDHGLSVNAASQTATEGKQAEALQYSLYYYLKRGGPLLEAAAVDLQESFSRQRYLPSVSVGREPSLSELVSFIETELKAKGRTVALHAQADSAGARQLVSMLSSWGCSVALFPLPRMQRSSTSLGSAGLGTINPGEETGLWAGVPHEYVPSMGVSDGMGSDPYASVGLEVDALGAPMAGTTQRNLRTAVALVPDGKPSLVSYPSGLQLPLLPQASSGEGARRGRGSVDTVIPTEGKEVPMMSHFSSADAAPFDAAVLDPVTGVPLAVSGSGQGTDAISDHLATEDTITAGLSSQIVPFSFVIIDDDVEVLQRELLRLQSAVPMLRSALGSPAQTPGIFSQWDPLSMRKPSPRSSTSKGRPVLPHRAGSNAQIQRVLAEERGEAYVKPQPPPSSSPMQKVPSTADSPTYAIIHLTSLGKFRLVRDFVRSMIESTSAQQRAGLPLSLPEILVIPKPIGPRRLLTTLHTAVHKPLVDEFFVPIATSPLNPGMSSTSGQGPAFLDVFGRESSLRARRSVDPDSAPLLDALDTQVRTAEGDPVGAAHLQPATMEAIQDMTQVDNAQPGDPNDNVKAQTPATGAPAKGRVDSSLPVPSASPGTQTPWSGASVAGKRSHPSSPLPMDALEYFNETASRMGSRAASGMLVQSADGKSAGIFFRPGDHGRSQSGSGHHRHASTDAADSDRGSGTAQSSTSSRWPPPSQQHGDLQLRDLRRQSSTTVQPSADTTSIISSRGRRSPSIGQQIPGRPFPSGSLFSPEVGIEAVLAGSAPPVATPLGPPNRQPGSPTLWEPNSMPGPAAVIAASGTPSARSPQQFSTVSPPESVMPPPPSPGLSPVPKELELPADDSDVRPEARHGLSSGPSLASSHHLHPRGAGQWPPGQKQAGVAMTPQMSTRGAKPSALPQPGLLIGAGFAAKDKRVMAPRKSLLHEPVLPPIKVLIVEDNPINQRIMAKFMDKKKIKYEIATNGKDAIERWQGGGFHLILMDIQLPVMDGIEATREIRRLERSANIGILPNTPPTAHTTSSRRDIDWPAMSPARPVMSPFRASVIIVALTASVFNPDRVAALAAGCNDYLTKPVNHNWLEKKIIEWGSMQYILLSGFPSNNWDRWREERRLDAATVAAGPGANRQIVRDIRRGFNSLPDENARKLASKLHISRPARSGQVSPGPPVAGQTVSGRIVPADLGHSTLPGLRSGSWANESGTPGRRSSTSTDSSGSSIRLHSASPANVGSDLNHGLAMGSTQGLPVLAETSASADADVVHPLVMPSPLLPQPGPDESGDPALLAVSPLQVPVPSPVAEEEVKKLINENQVTETLPDESAVQDLAD
ncbi:unnamed protein product [Tilletia laevis]|nr:unnamed protein product [Tilletia caries]CAD6904710.1 unnamed protein product [Tilletia laevis]CAD7068776.1 unnamed protein product [Tilletia caries]